MKSVNNKILVRADVSQKSKMVINGVVFKTAALFDSNFREKSPTVAQVVNGNKFVKSGDIIICHHNTFYLPSPFHVENDLFSIPFDKIVFGTLDEKGNINPLAGNILCHRVQKKEDNIPLEFRKSYIDRAVVFDGTGTNYKERQTILHKPNAGYDIVYNLDGIEKRVTKVHESQVVGILD